MPTLHEQDIGIAAHRIPYLCPINYALPMPPALLVACLSMPCYLCPTSLSPTYIPPTFALKKKLAAHYVGLTSIGRLVWS